ncbi:MAG: DUF4190 domain-containing protein [Planctomycetes bacterium]|nr:DUF4190 domain-containing protein [Planctomycetota bacterium]MCH8119081.1 DUF4190 domain-containing protein [Planctomycetota bacterium]
MYCPKCGKENPDNAQLCHSCSSVLTSTPTQAPALGVKTSGLAIASFVLGMLGFCAFFITAIPAIILGIVALVKIRKSAGQLTGKGLAIAGIVVPAVSLLFITYHVGNVTSRGRQNQRNSIPNGLRRKYVGHLQGNAYLCQ